MRDGFRIVDADGHVEPGIVADWKRYVSGPQGEAIERLAKAWYFPSAHGSSTQRGAWDPAGRLVDMDKEGIDVAVLFGSSKGVHVYTGDDAVLAPAVASAFNNWLHEYCGRDPARLKGAAWVPLDDIGEACREARRAVAELGAAGIVMHPYTKNFTLDSPYFFPLYEAAESLDSPILVHATGQAGRFLQERYQSHFRTHSIAFPLSLMLSSMDAVCGGLLERFKKLRIAFLEGGVGWIPWWLDRLDEHFEKLPQHVPFISEKPKDLVKRYISEGRLFWTCEPEEQYLPMAVRELGEDFITYASDYPHWDCAYPVSADLIIRREDLSQSAKGKILGDNALRLYGAAVRS